MGEDERLDGGEQATPGTEATAAGATPAEPETAAAPADAAPAEPEAAAAEPGTAPVEAETATTVLGEPVAATGPAAGDTTPLSTKPRKRRRRWVIALSVLGAVIVVLIIASFVTAHFTSTNSFCNGCHEMNPYYQSWQHSTHADAQCRDCHIPPGAFSYIKTKFSSWRELYVHFTGNPEAPLAVTREIPNSSCLRCHENPPPDPQLPTVTFSHAKHSNINCITCHERLVHRTVNPPYYKNPAAMSSCLECHNGALAPDNCSYCHTPPHEARGECSNCHNQQSWTEASFTHPFPLTGGHAGLTCTDCHVSKPGAEIIPGTDLPRPDPACISCHGDHHNGLTDCASCHTTDGWQNTSFVHPQVGEHIPSGEKPLQCTECHQSGYSSATCTPCHQGTPGGD